MHGVLGVLSEAGRRWQEAPTGAEAGKRRPDNSLSGTEALLLIAQEFPSYTICSSVLSRRALAHCGRLPVYT